MADEYQFLDYDGLAKFKNQLNGVDIVTAAGDGEAYTASIPNVTELKKGMMLTIIPDTTSTATIPSLNVNSLGAKNIKQKLSVNTSLTAAAANDEWMIAGKPVALMYDGTQWVTLSARSSANDIYGTLGLESGGTNAKDGATGLANLFAAGYTVLSAYQFGPSLPQPGVKGRLFFKQVIE